MRFVLFLFIAFIVACSSKVLVPESKPLEYNKQIRSLIVDQTSMDEVEKIFGKTTKINTSNGHISLQYNDPKTNAQRLTLTFLESNQMLTQILWIPSENESVYLRAEAKRSFKGATFKEFKEDENNPHINSKGATLLIDDSNGVTIRYNQNAKMLEAIAIYSMTNRIPANVMPQKKVPYTLSENAEITKKQ